VPGAPLEPERLKAEVYIPPEFLAEHPELHSTVAFLVQTVIERIGMAMAADCRCKALAIWPLTQHGYHGSPFSPTALIPAPTTPCSANYLFLGRPLGQLSLSALTTGPTLPGLSPAYEDNIAVFDIDELELDAVTTQAFGRIKELEGENEELRLTINSLNALNTSMQVEYQECEGLLKAEVESLASEVAKLQVQLRNSRGVSTIIYGYVSYTELF
jgi:hypothetical protein